ncbi:hypothetical protein IMSHALPRED_008075 [Imshaugia aleurites]|uniref:BTB domain-containing protein n=1 Tax=Imshaugia aleurites TaxID=172621 RepID=A0A8H3FVX1_9LECA|nr:hypothetical protein IMSHALPRED_008075 [Imshaugia aleurites]
MAVRIALHPINLHDGSMVKVYVGPENNCFFVPREILCSQSIYCDRLLNRIPAGQLVDSVYLKEDEPAAFGLLTEWMLDETLALDIHEITVLTKINAPGGEDALEEGLHLLCALYCLCERIQVPKIEAEILKQIRGLVRHGSKFSLQPPTVRMVLKNAPETSMLHEYVLQGVTDDLLDERGHDYDHYSELLEGPRAVQGMVKALFKRMKRRGFDWSRQPGTS